MSRRSRLILIVALVVAGVEPLLAGVPSAVAASVLPAVNPQIGPATVGFATHRVLATRYTSKLDKQADGRPKATESSVEVAVPDKCVKFAALGQTTNLRNQGCSAGYRTDLDYRVVVRTDDGRTATFPVREVGPWNEDDNYWAAPLSSRPRRLFGDLPRGTPEPDAAITRGYNTVANCKNLDGTLSGRAGGADQFGRCIRNPAGIDLSHPAAAQLGLTDNAYLTVTFLWEPLQQIKVVVASADEPAGSPRRVGVINGCGAGWVKEGDITAPFQQQVNCGDVSVLTLGGNRVGVINACRSAYVKEGALNAPFRQQVDCGDGVDLSLSGTRVGVANACGAFYVKEGALNGPFRQQTGCGDTLSIDVGTSRLGVVNGCGALYVKEAGIESPFRQVMPCGEAREVAISSNRIGVVNGCGSFLVNEGPITAPLQRQSDCAGTKAISVTNARVGYVSACGAAFVKEGSVSGGYTTVVGCGDAQALALSGQRIGLINGCGSFYANEGPINSPFRRMTDCGDARAITLSG